jgi:hypothetical protein
MPNYTTRLSLVEPLGSDPVSDGRIAITTNAEALDSAVIVTEGTLVDRPSSSLIYGQTYYATDVELWYFYNGSGWETVLLSGVSWAELTPGSDWQLIESKPASARIFGDEVQLSGGLECNTSGSGFLASVSEAMQPPEPRVFAVPYATGSGFGTPATLNVLTDSNLDLANPDTYTAGDAVYLDGLSYRLS